MSTGFRPQSCVLGAAFSHNKMFSSADTHRVCHRRRPAGEGHATCAWLTAGSTACALLTWRRLVCSGRTMALRPASRSSGERRRCMSSAALRSSAPRKALLSGPFKASSPVLRPASAGTPPNELRRDARTRVKGCIERRTTSKPSACVLCVPLQRRTVICDHGDWSRGRRGRGRDYSSPHDARAEVRTRPRIVD